jgi:hypothetical protein
VGGGGKRGLNPLQIWIRVRKYFLVHFSSSCLAPGGGCGGGGGEGGESAFIW